MSTDGRDGRAGLVHEAALYGSEREFLAVVVPFLAGGAEAGEPTFSAFSEPVATLVRDALPDPTRVTFLPHDQLYATPATTIRAYREAVTDLLADGARQIRITGEVPHSGLGTPWRGWARYEAAVNHTFAGFPCGVCAPTTPEPPRPTCWPTCAGRTPG